MLSPAYQDALNVALLIETCDECKTRDGLCPAHRWEVLPKLARPGWVQRIGPTHCEQTGVQNEEEEADAMEARRYAALRAMAANALAKRHKHARRARQRALLAELAA